MIFFASDLHLSDQTPDLVAHFEKLLHRAKGQSLFILGDFFDVWAGDDVLDAPHHDFERKIVSLLSDAANQGTRISFLHGNRDFLLGERFAKAARITLLSDPLVLRSENATFLLSHGDALCTDDVAYMHFRQEVRNPLWQQAFLQKPFVEREAIASALRAQSEAGKTGYAADLPLSAVEAFLASYAQEMPFDFIHGHTHLPDCHEHFVGGRRISRWVLRDWHDTKAEVLVYDCVRLKREVII